MYWASEHRKREGGAEQLNEQEFTILQIVYGTKCLLHHNSSRAPWFLLLVHLACFELEMLLLLVTRNISRHNHDMFLAGAFETK